MNKKKAISKQFAIELLISLHQTDVHVGQLDIILSDMEEGPAKEKFRVALGALISIISADLMVPIYNKHPDLGRASEPGSWLEREQAC